MVTLTMLLPVLGAVMAANEKGFEPPQGAVVVVRTTLARALAGANSSSLSEAEGLSLLNDATAKALEQLQPHGPAADRLAEAAKPLDRLSAGQQLARLKQAIVDVLRDITFKPVAEASLPAGFPTYTPVGTIEVKQYPAYRMASGPGFWTLFLHIQLNRIEMTAPVQMAYTRDAAAGKWQESGMAFLYGDAGIGRAGRQGKVTVLDQERQAVVSLGVKGKRTPSVIADAESRLQRWIDDTGAVRASGEVRVMGYNSPYVAEEKQYFEVQIPLESAAASAGGS